MLSLARRSSRWLRPHSTLANNASSDPRWPGWQVVVGIEVHAQVKSRKKLFSGKRFIPGYADNSSFRLEFLKTLGRTTRPSTRPLAFPRSTRRSREPYQFVLQACFRSTPHLNSDLKRLNPTCVALGVRTALALNSNVQCRSTFDRKHYFYQDLPAGYQITQHYGTVSARESPFHFR